MISILSPFIQGWYSGKGFRCAKKGQHEEALSFYFKSLKHCTNIGSKAHLYECIARAYFELGKTTEALSFATDAQEIYTSEGYSSGRHFALGNERVKILINKIKTS